MKRSIGVVGAGPHFFTHQYALLQKLGKDAPRFSVLIELESQRKNLEKSFANTTLKPEKIVWIPDQYRDNPGLAPNVERELSELRASGNLDGLMVCTEPKAHYPYIAWGAKNGVDILVDKPITVPSGFLTHRQRAKAMNSEYKTLQKLQNQTNSRITVMMPRRAHEGYEFIRTKVANFIVEHQVPITDLVVRHAGGVWNMPSEWHRENHPYKYGYGGMLHSGAHQIDLTADLLKLNALANGKWGDKIVLSTVHTVPNDIHAQVGHRYTQLFRGNHPSLVPSGPLDQLGEVDVTVTYRLMRGNKVITKGVIDMAQTSLSTRTSADPPTDPYKKSGRLRQESLSVALGHLFMVRASGDRFPDCEQNFAVQLGRNELTKGKVYEYKNWKDGEMVTRFGKTYYSDLTGSAHEKILLQWLRNEPTRSEFADHELSVRLASGIYQAMQNQTLNKAGHATIDVSDLGPRFTNTDNSLSTPSLSLTGAA